MIKGIDVSENNGWNDWKAVKESGIEFAIIRLGYGRGHLDTLFYKNVNEALEAGLKIGVYYYSYALNRLASWEEASYMMHILESSGLTPGKLEMGVWFDMEDGDGYKERNGMPASTQTCCRSTLPSGARSGRIPATGPALRCGNSPTG